MELYNPPSTYSDPLPPAHLILLNVLSPDLLRPLPRLFVTQE